MNFSINNYIDQHARVFNSMDISAVQKCLDLIAEGIKNFKEIIGKKLTN